MDKKKAQKAIRKAAREKRIVFADADRVQALGNRVYEFIEKVFGIEAVFVSDESTLSNFITSDPESREDEGLKLCVRIFELYGVTCKPDDYIVDVVEKIREGR